jgi:hypothetical protein
VQGAARAIGWEFRRHHRWGLMALGGYVVLPVTTAALAGWPMLYGTAATSSLWLAVALFLRWPVGIDVPLPFIWPALLTSAYLAWTQAFVWMPYGLPGLCVIVAALWLVAVDATRHGAGRLRHAVRRAAHSAVHGRCCRRGDQQIGCLCARFLRRDAVHGDAAVDQRGARRRQAEDDDLERACRVAGRPRLDTRCAHAVRRARAGTFVVGAPRAIAIVLLGSAALLASTWKNLVQSLCIGLTGREWIIKSTVLLGLMSIVAVGMLGDWIVRHRNVQSAIWNAFPWILVALVFCKLCAACWVAMRLHDRRVLSDRTLVTGAACWLAAVVALYGLLEWFVSSPIVPRYFLGAVAILEIPLARVSAAPLALAWNRHR